MRAVAAGRRCTASWRRGEPGTGDPPALAEAAESGADRVILTARQPPDRRPQPDPRRPARRIPPSRQGPRRARPQARHRGRPGRRPPGDAVLIAGKGRQTYQIFADRVIPFDDFAVARACLRGRLDRPGPRRLAVGLSMALRSNNPTPTWENRSRRCSGRCRRWRSRAGGVELRPRDRCRGRTRRPGCGSRRPRRESRWRRRGHQVGVGEEEDDLGVKRQQPERRATSGRYRRRGRQL